MPVKLRLQRHGRKGYAFYHIVAADSRAPRDGKFIERVGSYNPNTNPATIVLDFDKALHWLNVGAQPTDTVRNILSREGVLMKKHLQGGVKKGAFSEEEAEKRFNAWKQQKEEKVSKTKAEIEAEKQASVKARLAVEIEQNKEKAKLLAEKKAELLAEQEAKVKAELEAELEAETEAETEKVEADTEEKTTETEK